MSERKKRKIYSPEFNAKVRKGSCIFAGIRYNAMAYPLCKKPSPARLFGRTYKTQKGNVHLKNDLDPSRLHRARGGVGLAIRSKQT